MRKRGNREKRMGGKEKEGRLRVVKREVGERRKKRMTGRLQRRTQITMSDGMRTAPWTAVQNREAAGRLQGHCQIKAPRHQQCFIKMHGNCSLGEEKSSKGSSWAEGNRRQAWHWPTLLLCVQPAQLSDFEEYPQYKCSSFPHSHPFHWLWAQGPGPSLSPLPVSSALGRKM